MRSLPTKGAFEGGGSKGIAHLGVIKALMEMECFARLDLLAGSSMGGLIVFAASLGLTFEEMKKIIFELDLKELVTNDGSHYSFINYVKRMKNLFWNFGLHQALKVEDWFKALLKKTCGNENITFAQWHEWVENDKKEKGTTLFKDFCVEAFDANHRINKTYSYLSNADTPIWQALRATMAYPVYFTPQVMNNSYHTDGGLLNNCPANIFSDQFGAANPEVLCSLLENADTIRYLEKGIEPPERPIHNSSDYLRAVLNGVLSVQTATWRTGPYRSYSLYCDTCDVETLDFDLSVEKKEALIASGYFATISYFLEHFPDIPPRYYDASTLQAIQQANEIKKQKTQLLAPESYIKRTKWSLASFIKSMEKRNQVSLEPKGTEPLKKRLKTTSPPSLLHQWAALPGIQQEVIRRKQNKAKVTNF